MNTTHTLQAVSSALTQLQHAGGLPGPTLDSALRQIVAASFTQPRADFSHDIARVNAQATWTGPHAQTDQVRAKFFGGNPLTLQARRFVVILSLNHKLVLNPKPQQQAEYSALCNPTTHFAACAHYFRSPHYYAPFFSRNAHVLRAFCLHLGVDVGALNDQTLLEHHGFFLEKYPFFSSESRLASLHPAAFCQDLNDLLLPFVLRILPPASLLLAGNANADALGIPNTPQSPLASAWKTWDLRGGQGSQRCRVGLNALPLPGQPPLRVVRCGFLGRPSTPNGKKEWALLGQLLAGADPRSLGMTPLP